MVPPGRAIHNLDNLLSTKTHMITSMYTIKEIIALKTAASLRSIKVDSVRPSNADISMEKK